MEIIFFQSLNHVEGNLKTWFLIKSGYYIVPSPSTTLALTCLDCPKSSCSLPLAIFERLAIFDDYVLAGTP